MVNGIHRQSPRGFQIERAVINEKTLLRGALCDFQRHAKDHLFRLAGSNVAGTEENEKVPSKVESFNAVLVELQRLVIDGADKVFPGARDLIEDGARLRVFLGLREHEGGEFLAREAARAIEQGLVEIFIQGDLSGVEGRKREIVAVLKFFPIQVKTLAASFRDPRSQPFVRMTPPMSQNSVVISAKGATPPVFAFLFRPYYAISQHVKRPKSYGAAKCLFLSALLRMVS